MYPDSVKNYVRLIQAIDRPRCAAHFDPVNLVNSPQRYFRSGDLIRDFVEKLGPRSAVATSKILPWTNG